MHNKFHFMHFTGHLKWAAIYNRYKSGIVIIIRGKICIKSMSRLLGMYE